MRRLKPATELWKIQPQWVVTPRKQTINSHRKRKTSQKRIKSGNGVIKEYIKGKRKSFFSSPNKLPAGDYDYLFFCCKWT